MIVVQRKKYGHSQMNAAHMIKAFVNRTMAFVKREV